MPLVDYCVGVMRLKNHGAAALLALLLGPTRTRPVVAVDTVFLNILGYQSPQQGLRLANVETVVVVLDHRTMVKNTESRNQLHTWSN